MLNIQKRMAFLISLLFSFLFFQSSVLLLAATNHSYYINDLSAVGDKFCTATGLPGNDGLSPSTPKSSITNLIKTYINFPANSTVYIDSGTYNEAVLISSTLHGSNSGNITFQGAGISNQISTIAGDGANASCVSIAGSSFIRITGFRITHPLSQGILVSANSFRIQIDHNTINSNSSYGIKLDSSYHCSLFSNSCNKNTSSGIYFTFASTNQVNMNTLNNNLWGFYMDNSYSCTLTGNNIYNNQDGIFFDWFGQNNLVQSNVIWKNSRYGIVNGGSYNKNNFFYNTIYSNSSIGLQMAGTSNQFIGNIVYWNTSDGISSVSKSLISGNICRYNGGVGIGVLGTAVIQGNLCSFNSSGIRLANGFNRAVSNNCSSNSQSGIYGDNPCGTNTISYNICSTNTLYGISLNQNNIGSIITHNLISRNKSKGVLLGFLNGSGKSFISNIVWKNYGDGFDNGSGHKKDIFAYNIVYSNSGRGIAMTTVSNQFIGNSVFQNTSDGIRGGAGSVISGNVCRYNATSGIYINGNSTVQGNLCSHNQYGFSMSTTGSTIFSNIFSTNTMYGLNADNCRFVNILHNIIGTNNDAGMYLSDQCRTNSITGNVIFKNGNHGINLNWVSSYGTFQSNYISRNKNNGINNQGTWTKSIYSYNVVCSNSGIGISMQSLSNQFIGNSVFRNGGDGIKISNGATLIGNICRSNVSGSGISALGNSILRGNICSYNWYGITLQGSINSAYSNNVSTNLQAGIYCAAGCTTNTIAYNDINKNGIFGIWLNANNYGSIFTGNKIAWNNNIGVRFDWTGGFGKSFISNIVWKNSGDGFDNGPGHNNDIFQYNTVYSNTGSGINRNTTVSNQFIGNIVYGNTGNGISMGTRCQAQNNTIVKNGTGGLYLSGNSASIKGNYSYSNSGSGITLNTGSKYNTVYSNICNRNVSSGIYALTSTSNRIAQNMTGTNINSGIYLRNSVFNTVAGNMVVNNGTRGIWLDWIDNDNTICSNTVRGTGNANGGIIVQWSKRVFIYANYLVKNPTSPGIACNLSSSNIVIKNNHVLSNAYGISLNTTGRMTVVSNFVSDCTTAGFGGINLNNVNDFKVLNNYITRNRHGIAFQNATTGSGVVYANLILRNSQDGINVATGAIANVINNVVFSNFGKSVSVDGTGAATLKNVISQGNLGGGMTTTGGVLDVSYSCTNDGTSGAAVVHGPGNITCGTLFVSTAQNGEDFRLLWNSLSQGISAPGPVLRASMGVYPLYIFPSSSYVNNSADHAIHLLTGYSNGSIPGTATIVITYTGPANFNLNNLRVTNTSFWGGLPGTFSIGSVIGQQVTINRSGGNPTVPGSVEDIILQGVTNASKIASNYSITLETKDLSGNTIEYMQGNQFKLFTNIQFSLSKTVSNITLNGAASVPIPGATITYKIVYTNVFSSPGYHAMIIDRLPSKVTYYTDMGNVSGWTLEYSTNALPQQNYSSSSYSNVVPFLKSEIKWIRWRKLYVNPLDKTGGFTYKVIIR